MGEVTISTDDYIVVILLVVFGFLVFLFCLVFTFLHLIRS